MISAPLDNCYDIRPREVICTVVCTVSDGAKLARIFFFVTMMTLPTPKKIRNFVIAIIDYFFIGLFLKNAKFYDGKSVSKPPSSDVERSSLTATSSLSDRHATLYTLGN